MKRSIALLTFALALAFALSPALTAPFTGFAPDQLPIAQVNPPVQPAGYAFAIWGVIYLWLIIGSAFGLWARAQDDAWHRTRLPLSASLAIGVPWLAIANSSAIWAMITIIAMATFAIWALLIAPRQDRWWLQAPIAIYAGWLTAASWVSIATVGAGYGIAFGQFGWAILGILGALAVALAVYRRKPAAPEYLAVVIWALIGIVVANGTQMPAISGLALLGIVALVAAILVQMLAKPGRR